MHVVPAEAPQLALAHAGVDRDGVEELRREGHAFAVDHALDLVGGEVGPALHRAQALGHAHVFGGVVAAKALVVDRVREALPQEVQRVHHGLPRDRSVGALRRARLPRGGREGLLA